MNEAKPYTTLDELNEAQRVILCCQEGDDDLVCPNCEALLDRIVATARLALRGSGGTPDAPTPLDELLDAFGGGCTDGYCTISGPRKGMHTNGGCRCVDHNPPKVRGLLMRLFRERRTRSGRVAGGQHG